MLNATVALKLYTTSLLQLQYSQLNLYYIQLRRDFICDIKYSVHIFFVNNQQKIVLRLILKTYFLGDIKRYKNMLYLSKFSSNESYDDSHDIFAATYFQHLV